MQYHDIVIPHALFAALRARGITLTMALSPPGEVTIRLSKTTKERRVELSRVVSLDMLASEIINTTEADIARMADEIERAAPG